MAIEKTKSTDQDEVETEAQALSPQAVARRHMLLKSLGKGSAVLAATVPIQTLAGQSLLTFDGKHQCSVSGMFSGVHSTTTTSETCGGYSPGWWGQTTTDSKGQLVPKRQWPTDPNALCRDIFRASTLLNPDGSPPTLFEVMSPGVGGKFSNTDEFHWICAWLNALSHSFNFPYSGDQVLAFYNAGSGSKTYQDALTFFKTYMENHTP
ncbi:hypothetical protein [Rhodoferax sediminis]|uniref:Uncharacterized protein n=1 Tax=Rhodoferax sediminis TaxID=2509614 RepID=A0A515D852_9BURK|nr:hypothetical protein [Rhodoferax sediminis]QDL36601.1 hypothetical protein EUB48_04280 [Rhodoferax sediminis]